MSDEEIVKLYLERREDAIAETEARYGAYLLKIADNILKNPEDSRECVNDAYFKAWCQIPDNPPQNLKAYLSKLTRSQAIDLWRSRNTDKRKANEYAASLSELEECVSGNETTEDIVEGHLLKAAINDFLKTLPRETAAIFISRYYYMDSVRKIAGDMNISISKVKVTLHRTRRKLKEWLEEEGFTL